MVRVYANLSGLSKSLSKAGLVGNEARSLAPFAASFTGSQDLFDFVDAGDKDGTDLKIRGIPPEGSFLFAWIVLPANLC